MHIFSHLYKCFKVRLQSFKLEENSKSKQLNCKVLLNSLNYYFVVDWTKRSLLHLGITKEGKVRKCRDDRKNSIRRRGDEIT